MPSDLRRCRGCRGQLSGDVRWRWPPRSACCCRRRAWRSSARTRSSTATSTGRSTTRRTSTSTTTTEEADLLQKVVSFAESAYDELSQELRLPDPGADAADRLRDPLGVRAEQHHPELHPRGHRRLRHPGAQPHGAAGRPAGSAADGADPARADPHLPVPHPVRRQTRPRRRRRAAAVVHGGHGQLHGRGRVGARPDVHARRGGQRPHPVGDLSQVERLLRLPLRPRGVRLHRGEVRARRRSATS